MALTSPRAGTNAYRIAPTYWAEDYNGWIRLVAEATNRCIDGKTNNTGTVTLTANQATTTLTDLRLGANSVILFMPTTANAAAEVGAGGMYISSRGKQTATITHANNVQVDRTFGYVVVG